MALRFIKKILVYLIALFDIMNQYLDFKILGSEEKYQNPLIEHILENFNKSTPIVFKHIWPVDSKLIDLPLETLIKKISIKDIQKFITITHTFIQRKYKTLKMTIEHRGKRSSFTLTTREQKLLLCCKIKRKDELIKFSFKFIRRMLFKKYRKEIILKEPYLQKMEIKDRFNERYLQSRPECIKYFESFDLSRKGLQLLSDFDELKFNMRKFAKESYIEDLINEYILQKYDEILRKNLPFSTFFSEILSRQLRHSLVSQGVINSLEQFIDFFKI